MNRILTVVAMLGLFAVGAAAKDKNVVVTVDKFTGKTTVVMKQMSIGSGTDKTHLLGFVNLYLSACTLEGQPKPVALVIYSSATNWQFLDGADVLMLIDGERINVGHFASVKGTVETLGYSVSVSETIAAPVDRSLFEKIASAKDVQIKIGLYVTKLNAKGIERIREFISALPGDKTR